MKKILLTILVFISLLLLSVFGYFQLSDCGIAPWGCGDYSSKKEWQTQKLSVGSGPEDMAIDTSTGMTRIIVSCAERRMGQPQVGTFYQINPRDNKVAPMDILPNNLGIMPHGIDVVTIDSIPFLYAISHEKVEGDIAHKIYRFRINQNKLLLDQNYTLKHPMLTGPNDIDVLEDGSFYVTNPMPSNDPNESTKSILGVKNGTVLHYDGRGNWTTVLEEMCYPNGVWVNQEKSYITVANGGCKSVERFPIEHGKVIASKKASTKDLGIEIPIGDNLMMDNQGVLWTVAHPCPLKFLDHAKDSKNPSPAQVFAIDPNTMKSGLVLQMNGELINAASTALRIDNRLYISQVFDAYVLVVEGVSL